MNKNTKGVSAVIATILMLMITIAMAGLAYGFISGAFTSKTGVVIELDDTATSCTGTTMNIYVKNGGTIQTTADTITITGTNSEGSDLTSTVCGGSTDYINASAASFNCADVTGTAGTNTIIVSGATTARGTVYCPG